MKELIYKFIDLLTGSKGLTKKFHGVQVKIPTRYINYFPSDYEKDNFDFMKAHINAGDTMFDIGAHIGLFSVLAAKLMKNECRVYAFEPSAPTYSLLKKTISINSLSDVIEPVHAAVGFKTGSITFYESKVVGDNSNSLVSYKTDRELNSVQVKLYSIDDFVNTNNITHLKFIKIDAEGAEYDVLRGARETLKTLKPVCTLGIHPDGIAAKGDKLEEIYDFINYCNYTIQLNGKSVNRSEFCDVKDLIDFHLIPS